MTPVKFTEFAKFDLADIKAHYLEVAPESLAPVLSDIYATIDIISRWPNAGRKVEDENFRQFATPKYGFVLAYQAKPMQVEIEGIFRYQDRKK